MVNRDYLFPFEVEVQSVTTIWVRQESQGSMIFSLSISDHPQLTEDLNGEHLVLGFYFGGAVVLALYNFFLFLGSRERSFLYYVLFVASIATYMAVLNGLAFQYLWPDSPTWGNHALAVLTYCTLLWALKFSASFLDSVRHAPRLSGIARWMQILVVALIPMTIMLPYSVAIKAAAFMAVVTVGLIFSLAVTALREGYRPARFFLFAWMTLLTSITVFIAKAMGLLPQSFWTHHCFQIASMAEMILLSVALADRANEYQRKSLTDHLTGLSNRRHFDGQLAIEYERSMRYGHDLSLLMIDVDHFKLFNDTYGHAEGDAVLQAVGREMRKRSRATDLVCRYGGEEFAVILPDANPEGAMKLADKDSGACRQQHLHETPDQYQRWHRHTPDCLLQRHGKAHQLCGYSAL